MLRNNNSCSASTAKVVSKKSSDEQKKEKNKKKNKDDKDATLGTKTKQPTATAGETTPLKHSKEKPVTKAGAVGSAPSPSSQSGVAPLSPKGTLNKKPHQLTKGVQQGIARLKEDSNDKKQPSGSSPIRSPFTYASVSPSKSPSSQSSPSSASPSGKKSPYRPNQNKYKGTRIPTKAIGFGT